MHTVVADLEDNLSQYNGGPVSWQLWHDKGLPDWKYKATDKECIFGALRRK